MLREGRSVWWSRRARARGFASPRGRRALPRGDWRWPQALVAIDAARCAAAIDAASAAAPFVRPVEWFGLIDQLADVIRRAIAPFGRAARIKNPRGGCRRAQYVESHFAK